MSSLQCSLLWYLSYSFLHIQDSGNSTTHVGTNTRQSPLRNEVNDTTGYVDPFEEHAATRRSDSVKGRARPLSTVDDSAVSYGARPPSFIEVPVSLRPTYKEPIANNEVMFEFSVFAYYYVITWNLRPSQF